MFIIHQGSISLIQSSKLYTAYYIPYWWETILETVLHLTFPVVVVILLNHFQSKAANILVYVNIVIFFFISTEWNLL